MAEPLPDVKDIAESIKDLLPHVISRFAEKGHRRVRVSLLVTSMDELAEPHSYRVPIEQLVLFTLDTGHG